MQYRVTLDNGTNRVSDWYPREKFAEEFMNWVDASVNQGVNYAQTTAIVVQVREESTGFIR